jgi:hypothetical protein
MLNLWKIVKRKKRQIPSIPYRCERCELLGICRDKERNWKCKRGCLLINNRKESPN